MTAFLEGPGCLLICWAMLKAKSWRFTAILLVSLGQLYGDVLYFGTCIHGGEFLGHRGGEGGVCDGVGWGRGGGVGVCWLWGRCHVAPASTGLRLGRGRGGVLWGKGV